MQPTKQQWKPTKLGKVDRTTIQPINNKYKIKLRIAKSWYDLQAKHHANKTRRHKIEPKAQDQVKKVDQEIISEKLQDWGQVLLSPRRMSARAGGCFPFFLIEEIKRQKMNQSN